MIFGSIIQKLSNSSFLKDSSWALIGSVLGKGLSLLAGIAVARYLGKDVYGEYGIIKNTLFQIAVFSTLGLGYTGTRFVAKSIAASANNTRQIIRAIYTISYITSGLLAVLTFIFSDQIAALIKVPDTSLAIKCTALIIVANAVNTAQVGILSGFKAFKKIAQNNTWGGIVTFVTSVGFTYLWGLNGSLLALLISMVFNAVINNVSIKSLTKRMSMVSSANTGLYKELIGFSIPVALQESLYSVVAWSISFLIIEYSNHGELGLYTAAMQWANIVLFIPGVLKNVILSYFSSSQNTVSLRNKMIMINITATFIPFVFISIFATWITSFYGPTFAALPLLLMMSCFASIFYSVAGVVLYEFISNGNTWLVFFARLFRDGSILILSVILLSTRIVDYPSSAIVIMVHTAVGVLFALFMVALVKYKLG